MPVRGEALLQSRRDKLERLRQLNIDPFPTTYRRSCTNAEAVVRYEDAERSNGVGTRTDHVSVAGRIVSLRVMGKASFLHILDGSGKVQAHLRRDVLGDNYELVRNLDLGDFLGVTGPLFRTHSGEVTVEASELVILSKSLRPLPEKYHGLRDVEQRYRQRYLDLIDNQEVREVFGQRSRIIKSLRNYLDDRGFVEVDTPVLVPVAAGALARPFATHHNALDQRLYMRHRHGTVPEEADNRRIRQGL